MDMTLHRLITTGLAGSGPIELLPSVQVMEFIPNVAETLNKYNIVCMKMTLLRLQRLQSQAFKSYLCNLTSVPTVCFLHLPMTLPHTSTPYICLIENYVHVTMTVTQELVDNIACAVWKISYRNYLFIMYFFFMV